MATNSLLRLLAVLCLVGGTYGSSMSVRDLSAQSNPKIVARDHLMITVVGVAAFTNKYPVAVDGTVEFPELGTIKVAGLTAREAADMLSSKLKEAKVLTSPQVTVELEQTANKKVTVNGLVRNQGVVQYAGELSLLDALVRAGGRLPEAADEVLIVRAGSAASPGAESPDSQTLTVDARALERGLLTHNLILQDGDKVFVTKAMPVTVTGYVRSVGAYNIETGMTVEQVLALAGGVDPVRGSDRRLEIIRKVNGKTETLKDVKKSDLVKPGDIIKVGRRAM
jgi:polysaccharide export outer membrane protein